MIPWVSLYYSFLRKSKAGLVLPDPVDVPHIEDGVSMTGPQSSRPDHFDHDSESDFVQDDDFDQNGGSDFDQYNDFDHQDHFDQDYKSENVGAVVTYTVPRLFSCCLRHRRHPSGNPVGKICMSICINLSACKFVYIQIKNT